MRKAFQARTQVIEKVGYMHWVAKANPAAAKRPCSGGLGACLGPDKLCSKFYPLFYSFMLNCFTDYSFNITRYSLIITIILMIKTYGVLQEQYTLNLALGKSE